MSFRSCIVRNVLYPLDRWRTGNFQGIRYRAEFEKFQYLTTKEHQANQFRRLGKLLRHAYEFCPFYRTRFQINGMKPDQFEGLVDLRRLPVLTKADIQSHRDSMIARNWSTKDLIPNQTGGSTGEPISFFLSRERACSRAAATWRHNRWAGYEIGDKLVSLWGALQDTPPQTSLQKLKNRVLSPTLMLNTAHITEERLCSFLAEMKHFRPKIMLAYAKSAALLARFVVAEGLPPYQLQSIITSAEVLDDADRRLLETTFGCQVFNRYGCREVSVIASECEAHDGLHLMSEGLYVEIERDGQPAPPGEMGAILVTDLLNFAMPLIRYRIGDIGSFSSGECKCGRGLLRLAEVRGRVTDFLVGSDGRLVSGAALTVAVIAKRPSLGQVQLVQKEKGQLLFRIATSQDKSPTPDDLKFLREETANYLGRPLISDFEFVEAIEPEISGKLLFSKSTVASEFLGRMN